MTPGNRLRIGLMLNGMANQAWVRHLVERLLRLDGAEISLVILKSEPLVSKPFLIKRIWQQRRHLFYHLYCRLDRFLTKLRPDAFVIEDLSSLLKTKPQLLVPVENKGVFESISQQDIEKIREFNLDVIIRLGFGILKGEILKVPPLGIWSLHHGDNRLNRGGPPGFWEVAQRWPAVGSILQILNEDLDNGQVIYRTQSLTEPSSVRATLNPVYWKGVLLIPRLLARIRTRADLDAQLAKTHEPMHFYSRPLFKTPTNREAFGMVARMLVSPFADIWRRVRSRDQWVLYFRKEKSFAQSLWRYKRITPPRDRFWADPHVTQKDGSHYVFFEDFIYKKNRGRISCLSIDPSGRVSNPVSVLERPYHLSYPFVFEWQKKFYMMPETSGNKSVEIYRCERFPDQWVPECTILSGINAVDATLHFHTDRWWLFANVREIAGASTLDELFLYSADSPLSAHWTPHPLNPIVSDVRCSRPAGPLFVHDGKLFRPSQACSPSYGYGIRINEVEELSRQGYREREVSFIEPLWKKDLTGVHTIAHVEGLTVFDARRTIWRRPNFLWECSP